MLSVADSPSEYEKLHSAMCEFWGAGHLVDICRIAIDGIPEEPVLVARQYRTFQLLSRPCLALRDRDRTERSVQYLEDLTGVDL